MTAPLRLPFMPLPATDEWFPSWVDRCAYELEISPAMVARRLGLELRDSLDGACRPRFYGLALTEASRENVAAATGLAPGHLDSLQVGSFDGVALNLSGLDPQDETSVRGLAGREWFQYQSSRACPACIAEAPTWRVWWQLSLAAVCPSHAKLLRSVCKHCGHRLRAGYRDRAAGLSAKRYSGLTTCRNRYPGGVCGADLTEPTRDAASSELEAQAVVTQVLHTRVGPVVAGEVPALVWFGLLRSLVAMVRNAEAVDGVKSTRNHGRAPDSAEEAARLLGVCVPALVAGQMPLELTRLARSEAFPDTLRNAGFPPSMVAGWTTHTGRRARAAVGVELLRNGDVGLPLSCIPQLVPETLYEMYISDKLPGTASATGQLFTALAVARLCGAASWGEAGAALDVPETRTLRISDVVGRRITDADAFWSAARSVAVSLKDDRIDYSERRQRWQHVDVLDAGDWSGLAQRHRVMVTDAGRRNAAIWIWHHVVGAHPSFSAALQAGNSESRRDVYRRFCARMPPGLLDDLRTWAVERLAKENVR